MTLRTCAGKYGFLPLFCPIFGVAKIGGVLGCSIKGYNKSNWSSSV